MKKFRVTAESLNVREAPRITGEVIGQLHKPQIVERIDVSGDGYWFRIKNDGLEGWSSHKFLEAVVEAGTEEFPWMPVALAEEGIKEFPGAGDNPRIVEYLRSTNIGAPYHNNDETAWCSGFVNWCLERAGYEGTDSAAARSWQTWGKKLDEPRRGCIVVFTRPPNPWEGHVAFYVGETSTHIKVFGGNQSNAVNISKYAKSRLIGYRLPG